MTLLGVISDTHGLLRSEAKAALRGCDAIVHAGDVGKPAVLAELAELAPVTAVRGNIDDWASDLPETATVTLAGRKFYVLHDIKRLAIEPAALGIDAVVSGHSHCPRVVASDGVLYLNPGSAGPRRFRLPVALALVTIERSGLDARIVDLAAQAR